MGGGGGGRLVLEEGAQEGGQVTDGHSSHELATKLQRKRVKA
jgi:hypothetical protein